MEKLSKLRHENEVLRLELEERAADVQRSQNQSSKMAALETDYERVKSKFEGERFIIRLCKTFIRHIGALIVKMRHVHYI